MFFKETYTPKIVDDNYSYEELERFSNEYGNPLFKEDNASIWNAYAIKVGLEKGLLSFEANSFGYIVSSIIGGMGYSCSTEYYFREEDITTVVIDKLNEIRDKEMKEEYEVKELFEFILDLYLNHIEDYTLKTEKVHISISMSMYQRFMEIEGETKSERFRQIFTYYRNSNQL